MTQAIPPLINKADAMWVIDMRAIMVPFMYLLIFLPFLAAFGAMIWSVRRFKRQSTTQGRAISAVVGLVAIPLLFVLTELAAAGILMGLYAIYFPKDRAEEENAPSNRMSIGVKPSDNAYPR